MDIIIYWAGWVVIFALSIYLVLFFIKFLVSLKTEPPPILDSMPVMRPIPIPTKGQSNWLKRILAFMFEVRKWQVEKAWTYKYRGTTLVIPAGFEFDGASIPRPFWAVLNPIGLLLIPGLIHDYGYRYNKIWKLEEDGSVSPYWVNKGKGHWDKVFLKVAADVNGMKLLDFIAWLAVKLGGKSAWKGWRNKDDGKEPPFNWGMKGMGSH
jgi:hypothetical protein